MASDSDSICSISTDEEEDKGHELHELRYRYTDCPESLPSWFHKSLCIAKKEAAEYKIKDNLERDEYQGDDSDEMSEYDEDELSESEEDKLTKPIDWSKYRLKDSIMYLIQELCRKDWLPILKLMVKNGLDPKSLGVRYDDCASAEEAVSVLNIVIESITDDQLHYVKYLVKAGWSVNAPPKNERNVHHECRFYPSPLTSALKSKKHNVVKYLMDKGAVLAEVELQCCGSFNAEMVRLILQYKPNTEESTLRNIFSRLLVRGSSREKHYISLLCEALEWIIPTLIDMGNDINKQPLREWAPKPETFAENIMHISWLSDEDIPIALKVLMKYGLNLNNCCIRNDSLLSICVKNKKIGKTFEFLLEQGLDINYTGGTPLLHHALRDGPSPEFRRKNPLYYHDSDDDDERGYVDDTWFLFLLELGADVNLEDSSGVSLYEKLLRRHGDNNEKYLMYLLLKKDIRIKPSNLQLEHFMKFSFITLAVLIHAGCRDTNVMKAAWRKIRPRDSQRIVLLKLADPLFEVNINKSPAFRSVPSLLTWSVNAVHRHLFLKVTRGKSIIQKLNKVSQDLRSDLADVLNFQTFYSCDSAFPRGLKEFLCANKEAQPIVIRPKIRNEIIVIDPEFPGDDPEPSPPRMTIGSEANPTVVLPIEPDLFSETYINPDLIMVIEPEMHSHKEQNSTEPLVKIEPGEDQACIVIEQDPSLQVAPDITGTIEPADIEQDAVINELYESHQDNVDTNGLDTGVEGMNVMSRDIDTQLFVDENEQYLQIVMDADIKVKDVVWVSDSEIHVVV